MPRATKDVERILSKKGFTKEKGRDHNYYFLYINGKKTRINTKTSRGSHKDISDGLLGKIRREIKLPAKEFEAYLNCTFSKDDYLNFLIQKGEIEQNIDNKDKHRPVSV